MITIKKKNNVGANNKNCFDIKNPFHKEMLPKSSSDIRVFALPKR